MSGRSTHHKISWQPGEQFIPALAERHRQIGYRAGYCSTATIVASDGQAARNFWVAVSDCEVVGTVALLDLGNHQATLRKMFVHASSRGPQHGVSARLVDTLLCSGGSRARDVKEVYLGTTEKFLAAHRFYERDGFRQIAASELPSSFPKMAVDSRFYRRVL